MDVINHQQAEREAQRMRVNREELVERMERATHKDGYRSTMPTNLAFNASIAPRRSCYSKNIAICSNQDQFCSCLEPLACDRPRSSPGSDQARRMLIQSYEGSLVSAAQMALDQLRIPHKFNLRL